MSDEPLRATCETCQAFDPGSAPGAARPWGTSRCRLRHDPQPHRIETDWCLEYTQAAVINATALERNAELAAARETIAGLEGLVKEADMNLRAMQGFADLWYFVMDEAPIQFEKIVTTCSPDTWMQEAGKLRGQR